MLTKYEHTQPGNRILLWGISVFLICDLFIVEAIIYFVGTRSGDPLPQQQLTLLMLGIPLIPGIVLGWALLMMSSLTVSIDHEYIRLRFGLGMWFKNIKLSRIVKCESVTNTWANGWGIHYIGKKCWLYNIAGMDAVEVTYQNGKKTRIGTDEPEKLADAIRQAIGIKTTV